MKSKLYTFIFTILFSLSAFSNGTGTGPIQMIDRFNDFNQNWTKDGFRVGDVIQENGFAFDKIIISNKFIKDNNIDLELDSSKALAQDIIWGAMEQTNKIKAYDKLEVIKESIDKNNQMLILVDELENHDIELKFFK